MVIGLFYQYGLDNAGKRLTTPRHKHLEPNWRSHKEIIIDLAQSTGYPADVQRYLYNYRTIEIIS